jgi:hypothetical protein
MGILDWMGFFFFFFLSQMGEGKGTQTGALDGLFKKKRKEKKNLTFVHS